MKLTLLFLFLLTAYIILLFYINRTSGFASTKVRVFTFGGLVLLCLFFMYTGTGTIAKSISKMLMQSAPRSPGEVFSIIFRSQPESCTSIVNFKNQVIHKVDCCIWMELRTCPDELKKIAAVHPYSGYPLAVADSMQLINRFEQRPEWWNPHRFTDSIRVMHFRFENGNEQSLLFNSDSTMVFVCDSAP